MKMAMFVSRKVALLVFIFVAANGIFYLSLCMSNDILFSLFKSGLWYTIFQLCKDIILLFQHYYRKKSPSSIRWR